jgi:hypothetical protein
MGWAPLAGILRLPSSKPFRLRARQFAQGTIFKAIRPKGWWLFP